MRSGSLYILGGGIAVVLSAASIWPELSLFLDSNSCLASGGSFDFSNLHCDRLFGHPYVPFALWPFWLAFAGVIAGMISVVHGLRRKPRGYRSMLAFSALTVALLSYPAAAASPPQAASARLAAYFTQCHAARVCNGSYLVAYEGKVLYEAALGQASSDNNEPLTPEHAFDIGSISKQFTAAAILHLAEQGKLRLDDKAANYLPDFPYADITLRQLLSHTSGVPDLLPHYTRLLSTGEVAGPVRFDDAVQLLARQHAPLRFDPGSGFEYSNTGYLLLAQVIARVSGTDTPEYLRREFFARLGMVHTQARVPANEDSISPRAYGFVLAVDGRRRALDQIPALYMTGAGGIYSTPRDLYLWAVALQAGKVMSLSSWRDATSPTRLTDGSTVPYGLGFSLRPSALGQPRVAHGGHWRGFKADLTLLPAQGAVIVQLTNNGEDDSVDRANDAVEAILAGKPRPLVLERIHWELRERLQRDRLASVKLWLAGELLARPARYDLVENDLNNLGYELLKRKEVDMAIAVFAFNSDAHPASTNAHDSLADAYLEQGDRARAIAEVQRMLELQPDSKAAQARLLALKALH